MVYVENVTEDEWALVRRLCDLVERAVDDPAEIWQMRRFVVADCTAGTLSVAVATALQELYALADQLAAQERQARADERMQAAQHPLLPFRARA